MLAFVATLFAQSDSTATEPATTIPEWISYVANAVLVLISGWLAKAKMRLNKAVPLLESLIRIAERGSTNSVEIQSTVQQARELVEKEK